MASSLQVVAVSAETPQSIDEQLVEARSSSKGGEFFVLVTAAIKEETGQPWCPDAQAAEPLIRKQLEALHPGAVLVEARCLRDQYKGNPEYFYRKHPVLKLPAIPTLYRFVPGEEAPRTLVENDCLVESGVAAFLAPLAAAEE